MAGGPNAASTVCPQCLGRAERTSEGIEDDHYECPTCGERFGVDWSHGQPEEPCWPPTEEQLEQARQMRRLRGR